MADNDKAQQPRGLIDAVRSRSDVSDIGLQPQRQDPFNALAGLLIQNPYTFKNQWFFKQEVTLDGFVFDGCKFEACRIYVVKGTFKLVNCSFDKCKFMYGSEALNVIKLFQANLPTTLRTGGSSLLPSFDADGRITIE